MHEGCTRRIRHESCMWQMLSRNSGSKVSTREMAKGAHSASITAKPRKRRNSVSLRLCAPALHTHTNCRVALPSLPTRFGYGSPCDYPSGLALGSSGHFYGVCVRCRVAWGVHSNHQIMALHVSEQPRFVTQRRHFFVREAVEDPEFSTHIRARVGCHSYHQRNGRTRATTRVPLLVRRELAKPICI